MMARVVWNSRMSGPPAIDNARSVPKKPVIWHGEIWLKLPDGSKDIRLWRSKQPMTRAQAQQTLYLLLDDLIAENGSNVAVDSGFMMMSR